MYPYETQAVYNARLTRSNGQADFYSFTVNQVLPAGLNEMANTKPAFSVDISDYQAEILSVGDAVHPPY